MKKVIDYYIFYFFNNFIEHINLVGNLDQDLKNSNLGYVIISIEIPTPEGSRVIIRTKKVNFKLFTMNWIK